jgi:hypothetical protein
MSNYLCPYCCESLSEHLDEKLIICLKESSVLSKEVISEIRTRMEYY